MTAEEFDDIMKSQKVRTFDMFLLGPFMMWYAVKSGGKRGMSPWPRRALFVSGVMTIIYNWNNYRDIKTILGDKFKAIEEETAKVEQSLGSKNFLST